MAHQSVSEKAEGGGSIHMSRVSWRTARTAKASEHVVRGARDADPGGHIGDCNGLSRRGAFTGGLDPPRTRSRQTADDAKRPRAQRPVRQPVGIPPRGRAVCPTCEFRRSARVGPRYGPATCLPRSPPCRPGRGTADAADRATHRPTPRARCIACRAHGGRAGPPDAAPESTDGSAVAQCTRVGLRVVRPPARGLSRPNATGTGRLRVDFEHMEDNRTFFCFRNPPFGFQLRASSTSWSGLVVSVDSCREPRQRAAAGLVLRSAFRCNIEHSRIKRLVP